MCKKTLWKAKLKATAIHLSLSLMIFLTVLLLVLFVFFPSFYFSMCGGIQGMYIMFGVDVVLGPLLTLIVFNPNKPRREIISDFSVIGAVQLVALVYGLNTIYHERPKLVVLYDGGTGTALTLREVSEDERFNHLKSEDYSLLEGVPITVFQKEDGKIHLTPPLKALDKLTQADKTARNSLDAEGKKQLETYEKNHQKVWVIAVMGKYTGAYLFLDKNFQYLGKVGEKSV